MTGPALHHVALLETAGPAAPALRTEVRLAARAALLAEIEATHTPLRRRRLPSRTVSVRLGVAAVTVAAAWATAVAVGGPDTPPDDVSLVEFTMPTIPLALAAPPAGLTGPEYDGNADAVATYFPAAAEGSPDFVLFAVADDDDGCDDFDTDDVQVDGQDGEFGTRRLADAPYDSACLQWERRPGQWVHLFGDGRYAQRDRLVAVAESLVDDEQVVPLQVHLAPAGWELQAFKMSGRILSLANPAFPDESLSVEVRDEAIPVEELPAQLDQVTGPVRPVTVYGRAAQLVPTGYGWYLQAQFPDGTVFAVQAPAAFTADDVLAVAEQVTYTPPAG